MIVKWPGPAQREGYEPRQVRKEAAVVASPCAAGRLAFFINGKRDCPMLRAEPHREQMRRKHLAADQPPCRFTK